MFKVCDQPHPKLVKEILAACLDGNIHDSHSKLEKLWAKGYSAGDIVQVPSDFCFCAILCDAREHARSLVRQFGTFFVPLSCPPPLPLSPRRPYASFSAPSSPRSLSIYLIVCAGQELGVTQASRVPLVLQAPNEDRRFPLTCMPVPSVPRRPSTLTRPAYTSRSHPHSETDVLTCGGQHGHARKEQAGFSQNCRRVPHARARGRRHVGPAVGHACQDVPPQAQRRPLCMMVVGVRGFERWNDGA